MTLASKLSTAAWYTRQYIGHGRPDRAIAFGGGLGDHLMCTAVARELKRRSARRVWMLSDYPSLFSHNADVAHVLPVQGKSHGYLRRMGLSATDITYWRWNPDTDAATPVTTHVITDMCRRAEIHGRIAVRPYLFLTRAERAEGKLHDRQVAIQSTGMGARFAMLNKEWLPERFQQVVDRLRGRFNFVQLGLATDPVLHGATDLRGKTTLRQSAAILAHSMMFIGLEGFLAHLSRAVDCRAVIVLGGRTLAFQFGYSCNEHLIADVPCANCWKWNTCEHDRRCMRQISTNDVIDAIDRQERRIGQDLAVDEATIQTVPALQTHSLEIAACI